MNFLSLFYRLGKQPVAVNRQRLIACFNAADLRELCKGKADWESITIPITLKFSFTKGKQPKMYFVFDKK